MPHIELHPLCTLFPRISDADFAALSADIAANGLRQPIVMHDGAILDGGNRYRACVDAGVEPSFIKFSGGNIVAFVLSANTHRRHLNAGQQAVIVSSVQDWARAQTHGGARQNDQGATLHLETVASRSAQSGASARTQKMADKVAKASPELARQVAHGKISLPKAAQQIAPKPVAKPKSKPTEPTVEALLAHIETLKVELQESRDNARELAAHVESYDRVTAGEHAIAKEISRLKAQLRTVQATRDQWMSTCRELRREVMALRRKAGVRQ